MIVSEFIEWLKTQDQDAIVEILIHSSGTGYYDQGGNVTVEKFDPHNGNHFYYVDLRGNPFVSKNEASFNKSYLTLGTTNN